MTILLEFWRKTFRTSYRSWDSVLGYFQQLSARPRGSQLGENGSHADTKALIIFTHWRHDFSRARIDKAKMVPQQIRSGATCCFFSLNDTCHLIPVTTCTVSLLCQLRFSVCKLRLRYETLDWHTPLHSPEHRRKAGSANLQPQGHSARPFRSCSRRSRRRSAGGYARANNYGSAWLLCFPLC